MTTTPNLGLTQYAGTDTINFLTQYNTDLSKIDTTTGKLSNLTTASKTNLVSATNENVTNIGTLASLKTAVKTSTVGAINEVYDTTDNGWISARATLTYASASTPTFVCNTSTNLSTRISVGMKIKLTQTTTKYFFVTAITSTTITLYGGTDYVLANATISNVYYSVVKSPYGFPMNPNKWSVELLKQTDTVILNTLDNTWKASTVSTVIPIGDWNFSAKFGVYYAGTSVYGSIIYTTISTNTTTVTNPKLTVRNSEGINVDAPSSYVSAFVYETIRNETPQTFTILVKTIGGAPSCTIDGSANPTFLVATCAYL